MYVHVHVFMPDHIIFYTLSIIFIVYQWSNDKHDMLNLLKFSIELHKTLVSDKKSTVLIVNPTKFGIRLK